MKSRRSCIIAAICGIAGVLLLGLSFAINNGPPAGASDAELRSFAQHNYDSVLWGAWLQAVGPALIVLFAFAIVHLADAAHSLAGWMTFFGATSLTAVSFIEITFYISALQPVPPAMGSMSLAVIASVQHLYFIVAAPAVFLPLGVVIYRSDVLPKVFGYLAIGLALVFGALGAIFMVKLTLPNYVTACASVQALWWLAAAVALIVRSHAISQRSCRA